MHLAEKLEIKEKPMIVQEDKLSANPFHQTAREGVLRELDRLVEASAGQRRITKIMDIPLIKAGYIGSALGNMDAETEGKALREGKDLVLIRFPQGMRMVGTKDYYGLTDKELLKLAKGYKAGDLPKLDELIANYKRDGIPIAAIYVAKPLDCLQFVNTTLVAGGARKVNPSTGVDLEKALKSPGFAKITTRKALAAEPEKSDREKVKDYMAGANPGDAMIFLAREYSVKSVGQARAWEQANNDRMIWLDNGGNFIDTSKMRPGDRPQGNAYFVGHTAVYAGMDAETGRPLLGQSHINAGTIAKEPLDSYLSITYGFEAVAVVSFDFFASPMIAKK